MGERKATFGVPSGDSAIKRLPEGHRSPLILYTHHGRLGGDAAIQYLNRERIPFRLREVGKDAAAQAEFRRLGGIGTPLLVVGGQVMHGFNPADLEKLRTVAEGSGGRG